MKVIALTSRLMRDLKESSLAQLTAESRLELLDAINASIQEMHQIAEKYLTVHDILYSNPERISFIDMLSDTKDVPVHVDHIENYLIPIIREKLITSTMWRDAEAKSFVLRKAEEAKIGYAQVIPKIIPHAHNRVGTPFGF